MTPSLRDQPAVALLRALLRASDALLGDEAPELAAHRLKPAEFDVIATLGNTEGLPMGEVASRTLTSPSNMTRLVKCLEGRGLVERQRAPWSDRVVLVRLTAQGEQAFDHCYPAQVAALQAAVDARLDADEQQALIVLLRRLYDGAD